jgi:hypothetical protein
MLDTELEIFKILDILEKKNIKTITISEDGIFKYLFNSPTITKNIESNNNTKFIIPRYGDILLKIEITGQFDKAIFYQYDSLDRKVIYDILLSEGIMNTFPESGVPLLQCGKNFYVDIENPFNVSVKATYALLESSSRKLLANYVNGENGVKTVDKNGEIYQAFNVQDNPYSPNYFGKI